MKNTDSGAPEIMAIEMVQNVFRLKKSIVKIVAKEHHNSHTA